MASSLSKSLHTKVSVKGVDIEFFDKIKIEGVLIEDQKHDTLLYAGAVKGNLTDWFFLKDNIEVKYISLSDAYINANRTDAVWNYQFIVDYFDSGSKSSGKKKAIEFNLKELHLSNIRILQKDGWIGKDMNTYIGKMDLFVNNVDYKKKILDIKSIDLDTPVFMMSDYTGKRPEPATPTVILQKIPVVNAFKWNNSGWKVSLASLNIHNGSFQNEKETERAPYTDHFDGQHLTFKKINGSFRSFIAYNDTIKADVLLSTTERSGFEVKKLQAAMKFTPTMMEFDKLDLITNNSHLRDYYSMNYESFNSDMSDYIHSVLMKAHFKNSELHSDDIAFFAPAVKNWNRIFFLEGNATGTVDNFRVNDMKIKSGNSVVDGNVAIRGLPDMNSTFIDLKSNQLSTTYGELALLAPALKKITDPKLSQLGNIGFKGTFTGFVNDFVTFGTLQTALGTVVADVNMKLPEHGVPTYTGKLATNGFDLGSFIGNSDLGIISVNGKISGKGFTVKDLNSYFDGYVNQFHFRNYDFKNITLSGNFKNKLFTGHLQSDDPNVRIKTMDGTLSLSGKEMKIDASADIDYLNLQNLHVTKKDLSLSGLFTMNFSGNNIDNFIGNAKVYDATLTSDSNKLSFDFVNLTSDTLNGMKSISLQSNEVDANITGKFSINDLPESFKYFLNRYYPNYIKKPDYAVKDQDFTIDIKTRQVEDYLQLFDTKIKGLNDSHLYGRLDMNNYLMTVNAISPEFIYDGKKFTNINLAGNGNSDSLTTDVAVENIQLSDSLIFPSTQLHLRAHNDISEITLKTSAGNYVSDAELNASVQTLKDGVKIRFFPSSFVLRDKKWTLEKDGELTIQRNFVHADDIKFVQNNQEIVISTELSDETDETHIVARLKEVDLNDFLPFIITKPEIKGIITGTATLKDPFGKMIVDFNGKSDSSKFEGSYLGSIKLNASVDTKSGEIKYDASSDDTLSFTSTGRINYKDSGDNQMVMKLIGKRMNLNILQPYLTTVFSKIEGPADTDLSLSGKLSHPYLTGTATIHTGSVTVAYTQCRYTFKDEVIAFGKDEINLDRIQIKDTLGNDGSVSGKMYHTFFKKFRFDNIRFETGKLALLHTTKKDNPNFYGNVIGNAVMRLNGPTTNLQMDISGAPSELDSSHLYLVTGESRDNNAVDYIDFIQFGEQMDAEKGNDASNIFVNLSITANPSCTVDVILDETTRDIIRGQGNGIINIRVGTTEPLTIRGRYDITQGQYDFNFQTFLKKPFTLNQGYISWNGDPYAANIDIETEYLAKNVDVGVLDPTGNIKQKEDITIIARLSGLLQKPDISFDFKLQDKSTLKNNYLAVRKLQDYKTDITEMNKQVASLLLFNQFLSTQGSFLSYENTLAIATNTVGGIISNWLTGTFNRQLEKATKGLLTTYIDINPTLDLQSTANQLQANIRAGLKLLFSNRLVFLVGGNIEYNNPTSLQLAKKGVITPDITIEWLLNKEGSLRVVGFNRTSVDFTQFARNSSGAQLTYRKEFNRLGDILKSRKKIDHLDSLRHTQVKIISR